MIVHGVFVETFPYWLTLYLLSKQFTMSDYSIITILFCSSIAAQLEQQLRDIDADSENERTFASVMGKQLTHTFLLILTTVQLGLAFAASVTGLIPLKLAMVGIFGVPLLIHRYIRPQSGQRSWGLSTVAIIIAWVYLWILWYLRL